MNILFITHKDYETTRTNLYHIYNVQPNANIYFYNDLYKDEKDAKECQLIRSLVNDVKLNIKDVYLTSENLGVKKNFFGFKTIKKYKKENRLFNKALGGGAILDLGCYPVSLSLLVVSLKLNIDFVNLEYSYNSPGAQWWVDLSRAIVFGLIFSTFLTLLVTPSALMLKSKYLGNDSKKSQKIKK